jgi:hypothetical protein
MIADSFLEKEWRQFHPIILYITGELVVLPEFQAVFPDGFSDLSGTGYDPHEQIDRIRLIRHYPGR